MKRKLALGLDYGTESARALLVDVATGKEAGSAVALFPGGVMDQHLPDGTALEPETALQDPQDYLNVLSTIVPEAVRAGNANAEEIIGIGIDFTASTVLPTLTDGTPLCSLPKFAGEPYAWVKLWKDHAAQPEADEMNALAASRNESFLARYGGKISSEWLFPKALRMLHKAPQVYHEADRFIEAGDWLVWQLCGAERRSACQAGYKGMWGKTDGFPTPSFLEALHPDFKDFVSEKLTTDIYSLGEAAGGLLPEWAEKTGLLPDTPVAIALIDAHAAVLGSSVADAGKMVLALGTSTCHLVMHPENIPAQGIAGIVEDGIVPDFIACESGQSAVGDIFQWFMRHFVSAEHEAKAKAAGGDVFSYFEQKAAALPPGANGLLALDWWNGNRSPLMDAGLSGVIIGLTLATKPEDIYRALIEATAFGTLMIIENHTEQGIPVDALYVCGGLAEKNELLLQIYADVTGRSLRIAASSQAAALGAAIAGSVAAGTHRGGHASFTEAAASMARVKDTIFEPDSSRHAIYQRIYAEYKRLFSTFGKEMPDMMKRLRAIRSEQ